MGRINEIITHTPNVFPDDRGADFNLVLVSPTRTIPCYVYPGFSRAFRLIVVKSQVTYTHTAFVWRSEIAFFDLFFFLVFDRTSRDNQLGNSCRQKRLKHCVNSPM